jgi:hypothetical protein
MKQYFANFPIVQYNGQQLRNIILSVRASVPLLTDTNSMLPYRVQDGDTPMIIAFDYYGSVDYHWLIWFANGMVDYYSQWYKSIAQFQSYINDLYGSSAAAQATIHHYINPSDSTVPAVTTTTYAYMTTQQKAGLVAVTTYDWEIGKNEAKRNILLIERSRAPAISHELEKLLSA